MAFTALLSRSTVPTGSSLLLVRNMQDASGRFAWYFVQVASPKLAAFKREVTTGKINFAQFGQIITSGYGDKPPAYVQRRMVEQYGFKEELF